MSEMNSQAKVVGQTPVERLQDRLGSRMDAVGELIAEHMKSENAPRIPQITDHLVGAGGKRLRPLLTLAAADIYGNALGKDLCLAAAVEFIHTATLLHDDVVDESARRRGRPTANLMWDNKSSVLVGDYLFARAFQLMVDTGSLEVLNILSNAAAVIAEGEVLQMSTANSISTGQDTYLKIVRGKTAALFSAATQAGSLVAGGPSQDVEALFQYGDALGIAFQIIDDFLDYGGADGNLGKNVGDDFRERKLTLPVIFALKNADDAELSFWRRTIEKGDQRPGDLEEAIACLSKHGALQATYETAYVWSQKAQQSLEDLPNGPTVDALRDLAEFLVARVN